MQSVLLSAYTYLLIDIYISQDNRLQVRIVYNNRSSKAQIVKYIEHRNCISVVRCLNCLKETTFYVIFLMLQNASQKKKEGDELCVPAVKRNRKMLFKHILLTIDSSSNSCVAEVRNIFLIQVIHVSCIWKHKPLMQHLYIWVSQNDKTAQ